ncbi:hypothetical protein ACIA5C_39875 [Actinoplanes sp. NPDC051343]|uniref:hypothetical protein n=1 Tax=Actinoplanes sp. NPDC051343 TaxID=3363906 RepID=UPI0037B59FFB
MSTTPTPRDSEAAQRNNPGPPPVDPRTELTLAEQVGHYVDMWKKSVDVQQHFNDIEWRIRGLALTVATFAIGAAGVAAKDGTKVGQVSLGTLVLLVGLILWYAFYFVDRVWYHPLLQATVAHGMQIENEIKKHLPQAGMTATIKARSPQSVGKIVRFVSRRATMHSEEKLNWFYGIGAAAILSSALALQIGVWLDAGTSGKPQRVDVRIMEIPTSPAPATKPAPSRS